MDLSTKGSKPCSKRECYIPISKHRLREDLLEHLHVDEERMAFRHFCKLLESLHHSEFYELSETLSEDFEWLDPVRNQQLLCSLSPQEQKETEIRFLRHFAILMKLGNFAALTQEEMGFALEEESAFQLPMEMDWKPFESELLSEYYKEHPYSLLEPKAPEFANHVMIFHRGLGSETRKGWFPLAKLNALLSRFWKKLSGKNKGESEKESSERIQELEKRRKSLSEQLSFSSLWDRTTTLTEPTFRELIIVYRPRPLKEGEEDRHRSPNPSALHIQSFRDISLSALKVVFPFQKLSMKPADQVKLVTTGVLGAGVVALKVLGQAFLSPFLAMTALAGLGSYAFKLLFGYQQSQKQYQSLVSDSLYHKHQDNDRGVLMYLVDSLEKQQFKEAIIAYFFLWQYGAQTPGSLDKLAEFYCKQRFNVSIDFETEDALDKLVLYGLATRNSKGRYEAVSLDNALKTLNERWSHTLRLQPSTVS